MTAAGAGFVRARASETTIPNLLPGEQTQTLAHREIRLAGMLRIKPAESARCVGQHEKSGKTARVLLFHAVKDLQSETAEKPKRHPDKSECPFLLAATSGRAREGAKSLAHSEIQAAQQKPFGHTGCAPYSGGI